MITFVTTETDDTKIKVVGVGGGGCNAINNMINKGLSGVELIAINTDMQALRANKSENTLQIGEELTGGKGAGSIPEVGKKAAEESIEDLRESLKDSDMIFITCGMGGGTGTGASPVIAKVAKDLGSLVVGIVTLPFAWEGPEKTKFAKDGIAELRKHIDALIIIPNDKLIDTNDRKITFIQAYSEVDDVLYRATSGIAEIIVNHGYVNVDFSDVKTVMANQGDTLMGVGIAKGENRAVEATENALNSPFLDGISIKGAKHALINIVGGSDLAMFETNDVLKKFREYAGKDVNIIHGIMVNEEPNEELKVTIVATGFHSEAEQKVTKDEDNKIFEDFPNETSSTFKDLLSNTSKKPIPQLHNDGAHKPELNTAESLSKPKGNKELRQYESPAYTRRPVKFSVSVKGDAKIVSTAEKVNSKYGWTNEEKNVKNAKQEHNDIAMENSESHKPAFLRKIMD